MEERRSTRLSHKEWRKIAKKERRRRMRQKAAQERDANRERLRAALERNTEYLNWRAELKKQEMEKEMREREELKKQERLWLEEEARAQKEWHVLQEQKEKENQKRLEEQMEIFKKFEAIEEMARQKQEEKKRKREEAFRRHEQLEKEINDYIDNRAKTPEALREVVDNQPRKDLCPFFTKTGVCRYGERCSKNHRTVFLSKTILIPGFYSHFSLEKNSAEYDTDVTLEFEKSETWNHFREFYEDVITELESFGRIKTLKCCCNNESHLRGNMYIEYYTEREAARAWRKLKGRWYGGKQLICEFVALASWRSAICGIPKCPKGNATCNFLHTFRNPHNQYGIKSPPRWAKNTPQDSNNSKRSDRRSTSDWEESVRDDGGKGRDWRWSQSPEIELDRRSKNSDMKDSHFATRRSRKSSDRRHSQSERSSERHSSSGTRSEKRHRSSRKRVYDDKIQDKEAISDDRSSKRHKKKSRRRSDSENDHKNSRQTR